MSEIRSIITRATSRSLVLVDEICRGTETAKGTCIAGSIIETLDRIGCLGIISTHLHGIFSLPLITKNTVHKAMGITYVDGQTKPTWKLMDGICQESLAFETAMKEGIPETIIQRAEDRYVQHKEETFCGMDGLKGNNFSAQVLKGSDNTHPQLSRIGADTLHHEIESTKQTEALQKDVKKLVMTIFQKKLMELQKPKNPLEVPALHCVSVAAREQPPPSAIGASIVCHV